jgi:hypothetical protein
MMGRMPPSHGQYFAVAVFVFVLTISPYAHAADASAFGINDPFTDAIQLWSAALSSIESLAHQLASALQLYRTLTFAATPHAPKTPQQPAALAASAAIATQSLLETATTSEGASTTPTTPRGAISDQTTSLPFVEAAVSAPLVSNQTTQSQFVKSAVSVPATSEASFFDTSTFVPQGGQELSPSAFVTQTQFNAAMSAVGTSVQQLLARSNPNPVPEYVGADGNNLNPYAAASNIGQLSNVTIMMRRTIGAA